MNLNCKCVITYISSIYSYRLLEYEKIDAVDLIDTIGVTISYYIYGSFVVCVWCTCNVIYSIVDLKNIVKLLSCISVFYSIYVNSFTYNESVVGLGNIFYL